MKKLIVVGLLFLFTGFACVEYYPVDGYSLTGIRRLARLELVKSGEIKDVKLPKGALLPLDSISLNLTDERKNLVDIIPMPDPELQKKVNGLFPGMNENYSISLLDITPGKPIRYASRKEKAGYQPGSVGKIIVATALFNELCNLYSDDFEKRRDLLKRKMIKGGPWALYDEHTVPFYDPETKNFFKRTVNAEDVFSLYEWVDHMLSVSNNGAASVVWREIILMHL